MKQILRGHSGHRHYSALIGFGEFTMPVIARRFAIFTLIVAIFAVGFSAIVVHPSRKVAIVHTGLETSCLQAPDCVTTI
jgi:hypothetical protein